MPEEIISRTFTVTVTETRQVMDTEKVWNHTSETIDEKGKSERQFDWVDKEGVVKTEQIEWLKQRIETATPDAVVKAIVKVSTGV